MADAPVAGFRRGAIRFLRGLAWGLVNRAIRRRFPAVPVIGCRPLAAELAGHPARLVLVDAREAEEYAVSHLTGARRLPTLEAITAAGLERHQPIVTYCSVGYRSARLARELQRAGYTHVRNLEGSLFRWANLGLPLASESPGGRRVHPYGPLWGLLLEPAAPAADPPQRGW